MGDCEGEVRGSELFGEVIESFGTNLKDFDVLKSEFLFFTLLGEEFAKRQGEIRGVCLGVRV